MNRNNRTAKVILVLSLVILTNAVGYGGDRELMNVWHIPTNEEPPTVNMRNPVHPTASDDAVYFYVGGWPSGTISTATLHYRFDEEEWSTADFAYDSTQENDNEYFIVNIEGPFSDGSVCEYYIQTDNPEYDTTYVYGTDDTTNTTADQNTAMESPFSFTIGSDVSPTPTRTPTQNRTATPTRTPTQAPTYTPTAEAGDTEVEIFTNQSVYRGGDLFRLLIRIHHPGNTIEVDQYAALNFGSEFWYWPNWEYGVPSSVARTLEPRHDYEDILLMFGWPYGAGRIEGIRFYGALTQHDSYELIDWDVCECSAE